MYRRLTGASSKRSGLNLKWWRTKHFVRKTNIMLSIVADGFVHVSLKPVWVLARLFLRIIFIEVLSRKVLFDSKVERLSFGISSG